MTEVIADPAYNGNAEAGNDLSLLELQYVPVGVTGFQLYTGSNEIGQVAELFGDGAIGTGVTGDSNPNAANVMHTGANMFQSTGATPGLQRHDAGHGLRGRHAQHDAYQVLTSVSPTPSWGPTRPFPATAIPAGPGSWTSIPMCPAAA